ncbi:MAG: tRNA uridine-5-carboxymethylaminomethyl(34) synthesis enzyme MnmG [Bacteroidetes bacterium GWE2_29_8]|nr:MAG: tRNA uridine-5-carboxymethylaminomethyl(34) synthesis enzyme MnmG [Bacteroidetes bacterium GWE2_29_8]
MFKNYDIIVVGAGHAGCEAASIASKLGNTVLLITLNAKTIAEMSCNPSIGGIAKGQIVREIDAMGGMMGIITDKSMIQFRMLNRSKGPAMWSPRAQCDRNLYSNYWKLYLENDSNIHVWQDNVIDIIVEDNQVKGVKTELGLDIFCKSVILTNGTFLNGKIFIGETSLSGGRLGEHSSNNLTNNLTKLGFESKRMKTGTPVRIDGTTIDYSVLEEQKGDDIPGKFSFTATSHLDTQRSCYLAYTNDKVHEILKDNIDRSPLFSGKIVGVGPRYCPSIEDKIYRFADKERHQLFVEPDGWDTHEVYLNGFSSSLPIDVQYSALKEVKGFENAIIIKPGYAIEYDYFPPQQLSSTLETQLISNLFFAGQINGTTGYEEAAAQGFMAGVNANNKLKQLEALILKRNESYIGVLIDDLVTKGTDEPYRMFTSRAEYRILLRQDNADTRLGKIAYNNKMIDEERFNLVIEKEKIIANNISIIKKYSIFPEQINDYLEKIQSSLLIQKVKLFNLLLRPEVSLKNIITEFSELSNEINTQNDIIEETEIMIKYESYIQKEHEIAEKMTKLDNIKLNANINYTSINSLSIEARQKLQKIKPSNVGQASRISGISPSDISVLLIYINK